MIIFVGIAEFERDLIRERTGAGRADERKPGVRFGRPKKNESEETEVRPTYDQTREIRLGSGTNVQRPPRHRLPYTFFMCVMYKLIRYCL